MNIFYDNLIDYSGVVITPSSENASLPAVNVANEAKTKAWRTGATLGSEFVTFDLGSAKVVTSAILLNHNLTASDSVLEVRYSTDNFAASNNLAGDFTYSSGVMLKTFGAISARYWRIGFAKSAAAQTRDIGRIFLGPYVVTAKPDFTGYKRGKEDLSLKLKSVGGQEYCEIRNKRRILNLEFEGITNTESDQFLTLENSVGIHTSFFLQVHATGTTEMREALYVRMKSELTPEVAGIDSDYFWDVKMTLEEQL